MAAQVVCISLRPLSARSLSSEICIYGRRPSSAKEHSFAEVKAAANCYLSNSSSGDAATTFAVSGTVRYCRSFGSILFAVLGHEADSETLQIVVQPSSLPAARLSLPLLLRRHSRIKVIGKPGRTRSGEGSLFADRVLLIALPPEPAAMLKAARLLASSNELPAAAVADALGCTLEAL